MSAVAHILDTGLDQILIADVSIDKLKDRLFERNLSLEIAAFESSASLLNANARASTTKSLKLELIFSRADLIWSSTNAAKRSVIHECRRSERSGRNCHFLNNATDNIRDIRESSTINRIDIWRFTGKHSANLTDNAVYIFRSEILNRCKWDTIVRHNFSFLI